ncbi:hypothetical protein [Streptomyces sp. NPDC048438]|uniref:hypothetical protein n=1 Tax=Streptomyces sp. NPDC048438 TaxID=3365551 RepID=UPI0037222D13
MELKSIQALRIEELIGNTNHLVPLITDQRDAISWLNDRPAGKAATSNCRSMPIQL